MSITQISVILLISIIFAVLALVKLNITSKIMLGLVFVINYLGQKIAKLQQKIRKKNI